METEKQVVFRSPIGRIFDKFSSQKDVTFVYGDPITVENKRILPVAKVRYIVGGGGGYTGKEETAAQGEGGGGHISVIPVGVFEISTDKVQFRPVIDLKFALTCLTVCTLGLFWFFKRSNT